MAKKTRKELDNWRDTLASNVKSTTGQTLAAFAAEVGVDVSEGYTEAVLNTLSVAQQLAFWGGEVASLRATVEQAMDFTKFYIREGDAAGLPRAWMARAARVTRQTVYTTLGASDPAVVTHHNKSHITTSAPSDRPLPT